MKRIAIKAGMAASAMVFALALPVGALAQSVKAQEPAAASAAAQTHLSEAKLKACQNREKAITNIMTRIADRGQKQVDLFGKIADRTESFYKTKGKTLTNYGALVADVTAKKATAQAAVDATKSAAGDFKCDGTDPKGVASTFQADLKAQNEALKAYKTAVKNLIVGVKSVQGSTTSTDKSSTGGNQ